MDEWLKTYAEGEADNASFFGFYCEPAKLPGWVADRIPAGMALSEFCRDIDTWLSMYVRIHKIQALEQQGIHVYGGSGWTSRTRCYKGFADHQQELTRIYNASAINLDLPRVYQRNIITMRVFDVLACRAVVITEPSPQLLQYFEPNKDLFTYRNTQEMQSLIQYILDNPEEAKQVAHNGYRKVISQHLISQRVRIIVRKMQQLGF